ncbi:hypothetical protein EX30DRAFT_111383 [Ascodesmis nigricans]|uniref:Rad60/SUMO-like domain-containing protein n=1 Tax=Ascodesmis nigricans TaxID=341454 RepID=A0A4S2MS72_9PEZI|nr:hypothetical protein EX30DRAFT_111383 [Ascodesmis nigricans]
MVVEPTPSPSPPDITSRTSSSFTGHKITSSRSTSSSHGLLSPPSTANPRSTNTRRTHSSSRSQPADVVDLDSNSDSEVQPRSLSSSSLIPTTTTTTTAPTTAPLPAVPEEEDYFTRLTREARESRTSANPLPTDPTNHLSPNPAPTSALPEDPSTSPVIPIFVTTPLPIPYAYRHIDPDMKVQRRYLQNLVPVKNQYCLLLGLNPETTFFIFNGQRVFERSSLRSLGITVKEKQGNREKGGWLVTDQRGVEWREEVDEWCVVFELVNRAVVEKREAERRRKEAEREEGMVGDEEDDEEGSEGDEEGKIKITMKAMGCKDVVVMVTKETEIATLLETFRNTQKIPDDKDVAIRFEGDEMDPEGTIEGMDIDEDDAEEGVCVDVYVK